MSDYMQRSRVIRKVNITVAFNEWWETDLADVFDDPSKVTIISAVVEEGKMWLIYTIEEDGE